MTTAFPLLLADSSAAIRNIQPKLAGLDANGEPDLLAFRVQPRTGIFDAATANAIRSFKRRYGTPEPIGDCDEKTWRLINESEKFTLLRKLHSRSHQYECQLDIGKLVLGQPLTPGTYRNLSR